MSTDAALRAQIEQLTAAINSRKAQPTSQPYYQPPKRHSASSYYDKPRATSYNSSSGVQEVVLNGSTYVSSKRTLMLKPAASTGSIASGSGSKAAVASVPASAVSNPAAPLAAAPLRHQRTENGHRLHKATPYFSAKPRRQPRASRNRVLNNVTGTSTTSAGRAARKDRPRKQCRFFTMTGVCKHAKTCQYDHDPDKVAICPRFIQGECPLGISQCPLSHDPTPERVPLCVHFAKSGLCKKGSQCVYPHVKVGQREGVCRDFAVLGYCAKGADCDKQHIRECPNFAETGKCANKACKLPHVIRANRTRKVDPTASSSSTFNTSIDADGNSGSSAAAAKGKPSRPGISAISAGAGAFVDVEPSSHVVLTSTGEEEYIPLTFHESSSDDEGDGSDEENDESGEDASDDADAEPRDQDAAMEP